MTRILALLVSFLVVTPAFAQQPDSILHSRKKPALINPYKNLKISVFPRGQYHTTLGWGLGGGLEFRRFTSLREYYFFEVSYAQWQKNATVKNFYSQKSSYNLTGKSISVKLGRAIFGSQHVYAGAFFLVDAHLQEKVPAQHLLYHEDEYVTVSGDVTPYVRKVVPVFGYSCKFKGWKFMFVEVGVDYVFFSPFATLRGNWRVPNRVSGFLHSSTQSKNVYNIYGSIHFKL